MNIFDDLPEQTEHAAHIWERSHELIQEAAGFVSRFSETHGAAIINIEHTADDRVFLWFSTTKPGALEIAREWRQLQKGTSMSEFRRSKRVGT